MKKLVVAALLAVCVSLSGCILVPFIDSFKESGVAESDRVRLFDKQIRQYNYALADGRSGRLLAFVEPESKESLRPQFRNLFKDQKIVDTRVDMVDFEEESYVANVDLEIRYFKVPQYVVQSRIEQQQWKFTLGSGWQLVSIKDSNEYMARPGSALFRN